MKRKEIEKMFSYQAPDAERAAAHQAVDRWTGALALQLHNLLGDTPEATLAVRAVHLARFHANSSLALRGLPAGSGRPAGGEG